VRRYRAAAPGGQSAIASAKKALINDHIDHCLVHAEEVKKDRRRRSRSSARSPNISDQCAFLRRAFLTVAGPRLIRGMGIAITHEATG
jgi:hypothetical protein